MAQAQGDPLRQLVATRLGRFADAMYFGDDPIHTREQFRDIEARWDPASGPGLEAETGASKHTGSSAANELRVLRAFDNLLASRSAVRAQSSLAGAQGVDVVHRNDIDSRTPAAAMVLAMARAELTRLASDLEGAGPRPCSRTWLLLAEADLLRCAGNTEFAREMVRAERSRCENARDHHGAALCWLAEGDARACVVESPMTLGLSLRASAGISNGLWAREQARVNDGDLAAARVAFIDAQQRFASVGAPRGVAAAELRLAGLAAIAGDHDEARRRASDAQRQCEACGDHAHSYLAQVHELLADVARIIPVDLARAQKIGEWGAGEGSLSCALGLGSLLARAGRRWLLRDAGFEQAVRCAQLAEALFAAAKAPIAAAQALGDQFTAHQAIGDLAAAFPAVERAEQHLSSAQEDVLLVTQRLLLQQAAWSLAFAGRDAAHMEVFASQLAAAASALTSSSMAGLASRATHAASDLSRRSPAVPNTAGPRANDAEERLAALMHARLAAHHVQLSSALAPLYRASDLELDPIASASRRSEAWATAAAGLARWPEPDRWLYTGYLQSSRRDHAAAAESFARYFAVESVAPAAAAWSRAMLGEQASALAAPHLRELQLSRICQGFAAFVMVADAPRARAQLSRLIALDGEDWWKRASVPWEALADQADLLRLEGNAAAALGCYQTARDLVEMQGATLRDDSSKTAFADSRAAQRLFVSAALAALAVSDKDRAFDFLERGRARALSDLVSDARATAISKDPIVVWREACARRNLTRTLVKRELAADKRHTEQIASLQKQLDEHERDVSKFEATAVAQAPRRVQLLDTRAAVASLKEVCDGIPAGVAVIEISLVDDTLLGWALTCNGMVSTLQQQLHDGRALRRDARDFQLACAQPGRSLAAGARLASALLMPFAPAIRAAHQVVFVVAGELALVPFHALPFDDAPLITRVAVSYAPSAGLLRVLRAEPVAEQPILIVGDPPKMSLLPDDKHPLSALPGARWEAQAIGGLVPGSRVLIDDATRDNVTAALPQFRVIHLATHGVVGERSPWQSAIMLARSEQLTALDLMGLKLSADLVILSACDTGAGTLTHGEEVLGLARALLAAGARAVIVSLWKADDQATRMLMVEFHRRLQDGMKPAEALREAQLYVRGLDRTTVEAAAVARGITAEQAAARRKVDLAEETPQPAGYDHPKYWAPFVLMGV